MTLPPDFVRFLRYTLGSIAETVTRLEEGHDRQYFTAVELEDPLTIARRASAATTGLIQALQKRGP